MTARIDGNQSTPLSSHVDRAESGRANERAQNQTKAPKAADRVEVSSDATLLNAAVQAAQDTPPIRSEKVEAARKALAEGTLGADANTLADAIIDHLLDDTK